MIEYIITSIIIMVMGDFEIHQIERYCSRRSDKKRFRQM